MDIREFVFRHMQHETNGPDPAREEINISLRKATIVNDPECRELCARFLFTEIYLEGKVGAYWSYEADKWEPMAEYFINNIVSSAEFMHDCIQFFADIREGREEKYVS